MTDNKSLGQIAYEAASKSDHDPIPWDDPLNKDLGFHVDWEAAASAVWNKAVEECAKQIGEDPALTDSLAAVIEAVAKDGLSHPRDTDVAIDAIRESAKMVLRSLKGETDV